jgi:hypothetical protein
MVDIASTSIRHTSYFSIALRFGIHAKMLANLWVVLVSHDYMEGASPPWEHCHTNHLYPASLLQVWVTMVDLASTSVHHSSYGSMALRFDICAKMLAKLWVVLVNRGDIEGVALLWEQCHTNHLLSSSLLQVWVTMVGLALTSIHPSSSAGGDPGFETLC